MWCLGWLLNMSSSSICYHSCLCVFLLAITCMWVCFDCRDVIGTFLPVNSLSFQLLGAAELLKRAGRNWHSYCINCRVALPEDCCSSLFHQLCESTFRKMMWAITVSNLSSVGSRLSPAAVKRQINFSTETWHKLPASMSDLLSRTPLKYQASSCLPIPVTNNVF